MATNIGTQPDSPRAQWWAELWSRFISFFKRRNPNEVPNEPGESKTPTEPSPAATNKPSSPEPEAPDSMAEIKAALQRIEEALAALPRIEEALLRLPTSAPTVDSTPTPTAEHHVGEILLSFVAQERWNQLWAHKLLVNPKGNAEEHVPGGILLAETVLAHHPDTEEVYAKVFRTWTAREEAEPRAQGAETPSPPSSG
ncbi:hypothetical protein [Nonomuraea maritima]|uniref:hypothetical protein n=1 Tax=Nonomuraea maritima TaxID=683260 RepID=UPI003715F429